MKTLSIVVLVSVAMLVGCGKKEESGASVAQKTEAPSAVQATQPEKEAPAAVEKDIVQQVEEAVQTVARESDISSLTSSLTASAPEQSVPQKSTVIVEEAKKAAMTAVSSVDWANLSWNDVSKVPYNDKDKLLAWAAPQIDTLKEQLTKAAISKGKLSLAGLGDSGWQGAIKSTASALESVRNSSPETWEMARGGLMTAWDALKHEASKYISEG